MVRYLSAARGSGRSARGYPKTQGRRSSDLRPCASRRVGSPAQLPSCTDTSEKRPRTERGQPWNFARTLFPAAEGRRPTTKKRQAAGRETSGLSHREEFRSPVAASGLHPIEPRRGPGRTWDSADFRAVARPPPENRQPGGRTRRADSIEKSSPQRSLRLHTIQPSAGRQRSENLASFPSRKYVPAQRDPNRPVRCFLRISCFSDQTSSAVSMFSALSTNM